MHAPPTSRAGQRVLPSLPGRVSRKVAVLSQSVKETVQSMIQDQSKTQSYLAPSARGQKAMAKPEVPSSGERSQGGAERLRREEAGHRCRAGWRLGLYSGRVCVLVTKPVAPASRELPFVACSVSHGATMRVMRVIMSGQRHYHPTGEVPPCPERATDCHKATPKSSPHARVGGTGSPRPALRGCQQSQSRPRPHPAAGAERQNLRERGVSFGFTGPVSPAHQATKWPGGTSLPPVRRALRNSLQQPEAGAARFKHR